MPLQRSSPAPSRQAVRLAAIATAAESIKAKSFTIDGEAVMLEPDGLSRFAELSRWEAARTAILYAFDLIEHDGEDLRDSPFLECKCVRSAGCQPWFRMKGPGPPVDAV